MHMKKLVPVWVVLVGLLSWPGIATAARIQTDSLTVRPENGPGGTEVRIRGYVTPNGGPCVSFPVFISFFDHDGHGTGLYSFAGGLVDITRNIPTGAALGGGELMAFRRMYLPYPRPHCQPVKSAGTPFTVTNGPGIFMFTPRSGPVGAQVMITGIRFIGTVAVKFNGTPSAFTVDSYSQITATVPQGATTGPIEVDVHPPAGAFLLQAISGPDFVVA